MVQLSSERSDQNGSRRLILPQLAATFKEPILAEISAGLPDLEVGPHATIAHRLLLLAENVSQPPFKQIVTVRPQRPGAAEYFAALDEALRVLEDRITGEEVIPLSARLHERARLLGVFHYARDPETKEIGRSEETYRKALEQAVLKANSAGLTYVYYRLLFTALDNRGLPHPNSSSVAKKRLKGEIREVETEFAKALIPHVPYLSQHLARLSCRMLLLSQAYGVSWRDTKGLLNRSYGYKAISEFARELSGYSHERELTREKLLVRSFEREGVSTLSAGQREIYSQGVERIEEAERATHRMLRHAAQSSYPLRVSYNDLRDAEEYMRLEFPSEVVLTDTFLRQAYFDHSGDWIKVHNLCANLTFLWDNLAETLKDEYGATEPLVRQWLQTGPGGTKEIVLEPPLFQSLFSLHSYRERFVSHSGVKSVENSIDIPLHKPVFPSPWIRRRTLNQLRRAREELIKKLDGRGDEEYNQWLVDEVAVGAFQRIEELAALRSHDQAKYHLILRYFSSVHSVQRFLREEGKGVTQELPTSPRQRVVLRDVLAVLIGRSELPGLTPREEQLQVVFRERLEEARNVRRYIRFCARAQMYKGVEFQRGTTVFDLFSSSGPDPLQAEIRRTVITYNRPADRTLQIAYPGFTKEYSFLSREEDRMTLSSFILTLGLAYAGVEPREGRLGDIIRTMTSAQRQNFFQYAGYGYSRFRSVVPHFQRDENTNLLVVDRDILLTDIHHFVWRCWREENRATYDLPLWFDDGSERSAVVRDEKYAPTYEEGAPALYEKSHRIIDNLTLEELQHLGRSLLREGSDASRYLGDPARYNFEEGEMASFRKTAHFWLGDGITTSPFSLHDDALVELAVSELGLSSQKNFRRYVALAQLALATALEDDDFSNE